MLATFLYLLLLIISLVLISWYYVYKFIFLKQLNKIPNTRVVWPILGHALEILPLSDMTKTLMYFRTIGKTYKTILLYNISINTSDQKFIEHLTTSKNFITKSSEYNYFNPWLNEGLLISNGKKWFQRRKMLTPSFHFSILEQFVEVFNRCGNVLIEKLNNEVGKGSIDVYPFITLCALDVIYESTMGVKIDAQNKVDSEYVQMVKLESKIIIERMFIVWKTYNFMFKLSGDSDAEKRAVKILHKATDDIITARRNLLMKRNENDTDKQKKKCFLDILLESTIDGMPLSNSDIREEVDTFLFEGHDTTSSAIGFALYELSINQDIQEKVLDELKHVYDDNVKCEITSNNLQEMKYLEMVIKETLRKYPSVPMMGRKCEQEVEYDGMLIPKGTTVSILPYVLHREEDTFPDPERFDPERFSYENKSKIGPYAYIPFSAGFRNCIADNYKPKLLCELILRSGNGIKLKLKRRRRI